MTAQEQQMLQGLTDRINQTKLQEKDADAEHFLQSALSRNPDAVYILAQTTLVQQYALEQAQKQLADLKQQLDQAHLDLDHARQQGQQPKHATSFLGSLLGHDNPAPPPPPPSSSSSQQAGQPQYAPVQTYASQPASSAQGSMFGGGGPQSGGFLRSALQTATGVAAGALAFQGIESLMHGFGGGGGGFGGGSGFGNFGGGNRPEEVINNYYGDSASQGQGGDLADRLSPDLEDRRDDSSNSSAFADTAGDSNTDSDDISSDSDDSSSFDDSTDSSSNDDSSF